MPVCSLATVLTLSIQTGRSTFAGAPGSIWRYRITESVPSTSAATSSGSTVPAWPASTVIAVLPRDVAVLSR